MKIIMLTWGCDIEDISEPEVTAKWVKEISKDHDVTLFCISLPERYGCAKLQFPDLNVIEWRDISVPKCLNRVRSIIKPAYFLYFNKIRNHLKKLISEGDYELIHHLSPFAWRYPSPAVGLGIPVVRGPVAGGLLTPNGLRKFSLKTLSPFSLLRKTDKLRMALDIKLRDSYKHYNHLLIAGPYMYDFLKVLPQPENISVEVEHGLADLPIVDKQMIDKPIIQLLFVGRLIKSKGLDFAIKAIEKCNQRNRLHLMVVGDGEEMSECKGLVNSLGLKENVTFTGWKPKNEVAKFYKDSDIFVFPSYREPSGAVFMEAMSFGLPIITCNYGGADYMVDEGSGIKVNPVNSEEYVTKLSEAIDLLVTDKDLRKRLSFGALKRAREFFSWQNKRKRMSEIYESVSKNRFI